MSFVGSKFLGSHYRLRTPSNTFWTFTVRVSGPVWVFHPREYLAFLAITRHKFFYHFIQPCNSVGLRPTVPSPPNKSPKVALIFQPCTHTHVMRCFPCICNVMHHCMLMSCLICNACHMDNLNHTNFTLYPGQLYHMHIISNYTFTIMLIHLEYIHQVNTTTHVITKASNNTLEHQTNCGIWCAHKTTHNSLKSKLCNRSQTSHTQASTSPLAILHQDP